jgi:tape measure domain-containing protein
MATESKDVELRVRARDLSTKTLNEVGQSLQRLVDAQKDQVKASKEGQTSARELEASYKDIEKTVQALVNQGNLTKLFQSQAKALEDAKQKADAARVANTNYANSISAVENPTKKQIAAQEKLARAVAGADKAQLAAQDRLTKTVAKLQAYGIATDKIADAQSNISAAVNKGNAALETQDRIIQENEANIRQAAKAAQDSAALKQKASQDEIRGQKLLSEASEAAAKAQAAAQAKSAAVSAQQRGTQQKNIQGERALAQAVRDSAGQVDASVKSYSALARAVTSVDGGALAKQLREIAAPSGTAGNNLNALAANIDKLASKVSTINGPVKDFKATLQELEDAQRSTGGITSQIKAYERQLETLRQARAVYAQARASVIALADQMRAGGGDAAELSQQLRASESALASSAAAMNGTLTATRAMRNSLREAGVDTRNLAQSESVLTEQSRKVATAIGDLNGVFAKNGSEAGAAAKATAAAAAEQAKSAAAQAKNAALGGASAAATEKGVAAQQAISQAMRGAAAQAEASVRSFAALARSVTSVRGDELARQLRAIGDPTAVAASNVAALGKTIDSLAAKVGGVNAPVDEFRDTLQGLEAAQRSTTGITAQITAYQRQLDVLRQAQAGYAEARSAVLALAAQMRQGGSGVDDLSERLSAAERNLAETTAAMNSTVNVTRGMRDALRTVGVDTQRLAESENLLVNNSTRAATAIGVLERALESQGDAATAAGKATANAADQAKRAATAFESPQRGEAQKNVQAETALRAAMRASADQVDASVKAYSTLARAITSVRGDELSKQLREISNPIATANGNLKSLTENVDALAAKVRSINGPVKDFKATISSLEDTQRASAGIASQIDGYNRQLDVLRQARAVYAEARGSLIALAEQMRSGGGDADELGKQLRAAESALASSANVMQRTVSATRAMRDGLREAGVDTQRLAESEVQLVTNSRNAAEAVERLSDTFNKYGSAAEAAARAAAGVAAAQAKNAAISAEQRATIQKNLVAERALAQAMRQSADQAEASAKGYATLARSVTSVRGDELSKQLRAIADPTAVANSNITSLGNNIDTLAAKVARVNGPVKDFRATMQELEATQKSTAGIAAQIDAYRRQLDVLRQSRAAYAEARASVISLTAQMRAGGGDAAELASKLRASESALASSAAAMSRTVTATRSMRDGLREAGVDTRNLAQAETQLIDQSRKAASAVERLSSAFDKHGAAADKAAKGNFKFFESTRTTLSYTQRLRGEVLALATAYVGIQGAIGAATGAIDSFKTAQKIEGQLGAAFGTDAKVIREEWTYLMNTANRIGISFREAAPAYAKFAIAAKSFGLSGQETRFIFENLAQGARVAGLSADDFAGVLKGVEQAFSKGTVQAEELRGQLGDRLPGAFTAFAEASNRTTEQLSKDMELGIVKADEFINFARQMPEVFKLTDTALNGLQASQERYNNALFEFQVAVAESGFADAYTKLLTDLATLMKSADGQAFAQSMSEAFSAVVSVLRFTIEHVDELKTILSVLVGLAVGKWALAASTAVVALVGSLGSLIAMLRGAVIMLGAGTGLAGVLAASGTAAGVAAGGVGTLRAALLLLSRTVPLIAAVSTAILAAVWAYDKLTAAKMRSEGVEKAETDAETARLLKRVPASGTTPTADPGTGGTVEKRAIAAAEKEAEANQKKLDKDRKSAMKKSAKDELNERQDLIREEYKTKKDAITKTIKDAEAQSKALLAIDKQEKQALETDRIRFNAENAKSNASAATKEVSLRERVKNELEKIEDDIAKDRTASDQGATFDKRYVTRLEAISHAYDKLKKNIADLSAIDKKGAAAASEKLDSYIKQRQQLEGVKVTNEEISRLEKELGNSAGLRDSQMKEQKELYDAGLISQEQFLTNTAEITRRTDSAITVAADNLQTFVDAAVKANAGILSLTEQAGIKAKTTTAKAEATGTDKKVANQSIKLEEQALDALIAKRSYAEDILKAQFDLRMISEDEYAQKINDNAELYKAKTVEMSLAIAAQYEAQRAQGLLEQTLTIESLAALDAKIAKYNGLAVATQNAEQQQGLLGRTLSSSLGSGIDSSLNAVIDSLASIADGTKSAGEGFRGLAVSVASSVADILRQLALAIAKQLIFNALANSGNPYLMAAGAALGGTKARVNHSGGVVGSPNGRSRVVNPGWFANAPRFHEGGLPGLKSDEVPSILQTGEEVLSRDDPRNVMNGASRTAGANSAGTRFVLVDDRSKIPEAMQSAEGEKVIVQTIRRNSPTIKQMLK